MTKKKDNQGIHQNKPKPDAKHQINVEALCAHVHEDLQLVRKLAGTKLLSGSEIKLYAACIRRLLIDGGRGLLADVAARLEKPLLFTSIDISHVEEQARWGNMALYYMGVEGAPYVSNFKMHNPLPQGTVMPYDEATPAVELSRADYLAQNILFIGTVFISRQDLIDYVANKGGGVHFDKKPSSTLTADKIKAIDRIRGAIRFKYPDDSGMHIDADFLTKRNLPREFLMRPDDVDLVLSAFVSVAIQLAASPAVSAIEAAISEYLAE